MPPRASPPTWRNVRRGTPGHVRAEGMMTSAECVAGYAQTNRAAGRGASEKAGLLLRQRLQKPDGRPGGAPVDARVVSLVRLGAERLAARRMPPAGWFLRANEVLPPLPHTRVR